MKKIEHESTDEMVCPHCGEEQQDAWELKEDDGETECDNCEKSFFYERHLRVDYSTKKVEEK